MEDYKNIRFYQNSGKLTRMRKQYAPGLLFPSPRRPGYEANIIHTHTQTHPLLKLEALSTLGTPEVGGIGYFSAAVLQDVVHQVDVGQLHG